MFTGFAGWVAGVRDWLDVDDYTDAQIENFIKLAHVRLNQDLMSRHMEKSIEIAIDASKAGLDLDLPAEIPDFNKMRLIEISGITQPSQGVPINEYIAIKNYDRDASRQYRANYNYDLESFYCVDSNKLRLYPPSQENQTITVYYFTMVPTISATLDENIFTQYHANALLYGSCVEAAPYMAEDERSGTWAQLYSAAVENANTNRDRERIGSTPLVRRINSF